jgi:Rrf2 family protein
MVDLAQSGGDGPVARQDLAERQDISADYVAQLFRGLQAAGLVEGVKGPGGGYRLAQDPAAITAGSVVRAVEGPIAVVHCVLAGPGEDPACGRMEHCTTHQLWVRLSDTIAEFLDSVTVQDLCEETQHRSSWAGTVEA